MQPSQRELYFTKFAILVEGIEDVAFIATHLHVTGKWSDFRRHGCHFIVAMGKTNLSRPVAIARELCIRHFIVFDADSEKKNKHEQARDNLCILRLCEVAIDPLPKTIQWNDRFAMWPTSIFDVVRADFGADIWDAAEQKARKEKGYVANVKQKNNMLIAAVLEELASEGKFSATLTKLTDLIFQQAEKALEEAVSPLTTEAA
jgi:predicted ATP-dependent endonuclease of OLD family